MQVDPHETQFVALVLAPGQALLVARDLGTQGDEGLCCHIAPRHLFYKKSQLHSGGVILCHFAFFFLFFKYIAEMKLDTASDQTFLVSQCPSTSTM